jgi:hypothetical protein
VFDEISDSIARLSSARFSFIVAPGATTDVVIVNLPLSGWPVAIRAKLIACPASSMHTTGDRNPTTIDDGEEFSSKVLKKFEISSSWPSTTGR